MKYLDTFRHTFGLRHPLRVLYHWLRGVLAFTLSGNPTKGMYIIGVTGTKGKTTTSTLIARGLEASGKCVALLSTAQIWIAGEKTENHSKMTMDSPFKLWSILKKAKKMGVTHVVLETSSHGIYYFRNFGIVYDIVTLTNISQDHLDLHGTMDHYVRTKARLFAAEIGKICVLPKDCEWFDVFYQQAMRLKIEEDIVTYSMGGGASYFIESYTIQDGITDISITQEKISETVSLRSPLVGAFNRENLLAAYTTLRSIGIHHETIQKAWTDFTGVPGRLEPVPNTLGITVLVDYAHTEQSLKSVLETIKEQQIQGNSKNGRIVIVFGATGDRDATKRPKMGAVADKLTDVIVLTDDDTYTESSSRIIDMVREGISRPLGETFQIIPDRKKAIEWALNESTKGDVVIIAGKGCETAQFTNNGPIPWSDRSIAEEVLRMREKQ